MAHVAHSHDQHDDREGSSTFLRWIGRLLVIAVVLVITSFLTPGFTINGLWSFLLAALVITLLDYAVEALMKVDASPFGKGFKGFIIAALILYVTQFIVPNMSVSWIGAILAALVIGILDAVFPNRVM